MARKKRKPLGENEEAGMVRFSVIMAKDLLDRLDRVAGHWKRSQFIVAAVEDRLDKDELRRRAAREKVFTELVSKRCLQNGKQQAADRTQRQGFLGVGC